MDLLLPDMPAATELAPWLACIDANRVYTNGGPLAREFEARLSALVRATPGNAPDAEPHAAVTSSGTTAIELGLAALGIGPGSRVGVPAFTFPATALAAGRIGAEVVLLDVAPGSWLLTPELALAAAQRTHLDAVVPVSTFGAHHDVAGWDAFTGETGIGVVIDAAAAIGAQPLGIRTVVACSLHATKPFGIGEGGVVVTGDADVADRVRCLANFGFESGLVVQAGSNAKLSEFHAAVGLAQAERFAEVVSRRRRVQACYRSRLRELRGALALQDRAPRIPSLLPVRIVDGHRLAEVQAHLHGEEIPTRRWYSPPLHRHPAFRALRRLGPQGISILPVSDELGRTVLGLPFHSHLATVDIDRVVGALTQAFGVAAGVTGNANWRVA